MRNLLRALPNTLWWAVVFFAVLAFFTQIAIMVGRFGAVDLWMQLIEFCVTIALLAIPVGLLQAFDHAHAVGQLLCKRGPQGCDRLRMRVGQGQVQPRVRGQRGQRRQRRPDQPRTQPAAQDTIL